jgi:hypothetical protein
MRISTTEFKPFSFVVASRAMLTFALVCITVASAPNQKWIIFWDNIQKISDHKPGVLKLETRGTADSLANVDLH